MFISPIFDRTQADIDFARENRNDAVLHKGAWNYTDRNRLVNNMHHIADILNIRGHSIVLKSRNFAEYTVYEWNNESQTAQAINERMRTSDTYYHDFSRSRWNLGDVPFRHEIDYMKQDMDVLCHAIRIEHAEYTMIVPELPYSHYEKINDLERITALLNEIKESLKYTYRFAGTFQTGQISYLPHFGEVELGYMTVQEFNDLHRTVAQIAAENRTAALFYRRLV